MEKDLDPQKDRLYEWEDSWWGWDLNLLTLKQCRRAIETARDGDLGPPWAPKHPRLIGGRLPLRTGLVHGPRSRQRARAALTLSSSAVDRTA